MSTRDQRRGAGRCPRASLLRFARASTCLWRQSCELSIDAPRMKTRLLTNTSRLACSPVLTARTHHRLSCDGMQRISGGAPWASDSTWTQDEGTICVLQMMDEYGAAGTVGQDADMSESEEDYARRMLRRTRRTGGPERLDPAGRRPGKPTAEQFGNLCGVVSVTPRPPPGRRSP